MDEMCMMAFRENLIHDGLPFPVDIFIQDNLKASVVVEPHWHDSVEILYMLEGSARQQVNEKHIEVGRNDIIILNVGDIHSTYCTPGENTRILVLKFLPNIIANSLSRPFESKYILAFLNNCNQPIHHVPDTGNTSFVIRKLMMALFEEFTAKEPGYEICIKGYIFQLIAFLIRNGMLSTYNLPRKERDLFKLDRLFKYIEEHYKEGIDLKKAASLLNLSCSYFCRYFKRVTGKTYKEYIDFVRVCEVEKLLLSSSMNVSQAAYEAGFNNIPSFNRIFKRVRGYPPGDIKRSKSAKK